MNVIVFLDQLCVPIFDRLFTSKSEIMTEPDKVLHKVFVYGTLKKGQPNYYLMEDPENGFQRFVCNGKTAKQFPLVVASAGNIPFMLDHEGGKVL